MTFLDVFDAANPSDCYRRRPTVAPQQALALANSSLALDAAKTLAEAISKQPNQADGACFIDAAFRRVLGRAPSDDERNSCLEFLAAQAKEPKPDPARTRTNLVHVLLNHNEFVTIR